MSDGSLSFIDLVKDVYIRPIRSVLAIDDEFPTLEELLGENPTDREKSFSKPGTDRLREIIKFARSQPIPWLVDAHDGKGISGDQEIMIAPRLQSSDLMVLDYQLNGNDLGGDTAINILRQLATNDHFNLVLIYTKGNAGSVLDILYEVAVGLAHGTGTYKLCAQELAQITEALEKWESSEDNIADTLLDIFSNQLFVKVFEKPDQPFLWILDEPGNEALKEKLAKGSNLTNQKPELFLRWLFEKRKTLLTSKLFNQNLGQIRISANEDCCWISCEKLFITLLAKTCAPTEFETKIVDAIVASHPSPHRLLLAKMRCTIEERGLFAEVDILRDTHVQTAWLQDFLKPDPNDETTAIVSAVSRHWEALGDVLRDDLTKFGANLRKNFQGSLTDVMQRSGLFWVDPNSDETLVRYNGFVSTKPFDRGHLTTGHVFTIPLRKSITHPVKDATAESTVTVSGPDQPTTNEYWMCLSPACEMVPSQKRSAVSTTELNLLLPFTAVRLHRIDNKLAIKKATDNLCIFLMIGDAMQAFSISKDLQKSPEWEQMMAKKSGVFDRQTKMLKLTTITTFDDKVETCDVEATLVAQLRNEYAANLLQKFGAQLSRPGLGMQFKSRR